MSRKQSKQSRGKAPASTAAGGARAANSMSRRTWLAVATGGAVLALGGERWFRWSNPRVLDAAKTPIVVYASPSCACCNAWMSHMADNKFDVAKELVSDVSPLKKRYGVPESLWSCHTAVVGGYIIEGHVPADLVQKVVTERTNIVGLAAPGMPAGSPGMEGLRREPYDVISFTRDGAIAVYASR